MNKLQIKDFSWPQQRIEIAGQTTTPKSGDRHVHRITAEICLPGAVVTGVINDYKHLIGNFEKILKIDLH